MPLFEAMTDPTDALYIEYRDSPEREAERTYLEALWEIFMEHADPSFRKQLCHDFLGRYWEMALGVFLIRNNLQLLPNKGAGPDFRVNESSPIAIEAIAPGAGEVPNAVPSLRQILGHRSIGAKPNDEITLRIRSAICEKQIQYSKHRKAGVIRADECYVIAINPLKLRLVAIDTDPPHLLRATLDLGEPIAHLGHGQDEADLEYTRRPVVLRKRNNSDVRTDIFLTPDHAGISAILMSFLKPQHRNMEPDIKLLHNPYALNRLPMCLLPGATEYWLEGDEIVERRPSASYRDGLPITEEPSHTTGRTDHVSGHSVGQNRHK